MPAQIDDSQITQEDAVLKIVSGWMPHCGPVSTETFARMLKLEAPLVEQSFLRMESSGSVLRGKFTTPPIEGIEWCDRRVLARIHRLTIGTLRKMIEPRIGADYRSAQVGQQSSRAQGFGACTMRF